jgi:hypothetical protein
MPFTNYKPGIQQGILQVTDYPVTYDDKFYFSYDVTRSLNVLSINGKDPNRFITALFNQDSSVNLINLPEKSLDYSRLGAYNLIILNELPAFSTGLAQELKRFTENGGTLALLPSSNADLASYNVFLASVNCPDYLPLDSTDTKVERLNLENPVFRDVFEKTSSGVRGLPENTEMPVVFRYFPIAPSTRQQVQTLMKMLNGRDLLVSAGAGNGRIFMFSVPMDPTFSNLPRQAVFVPVFYNIALMSRPPLRLYYETGKNDAIRIKNAAQADEKVIRLRSHTGEFEMIPECRQIGAMANVFVNDLLRTAGNYYLFNEKDTLAGVSFNYDRVESDPECLNATELMDNIDAWRLKNVDILKTDHKPADEVLREITSGRQLWKYFVWLTLTLILAEVTLLRIWKH